MPLGLRQLAATVLKKLVREHWTAEAPHFRGPQVGAQEKEAIREALPSGLGDDSSKVRTAVAMAVAAIARWDCPQQWPGLIPGLVQAITAKKNANMGGWAGGRACWDEVLLLQCAARRQWWVLPCPRRLETAKLHIWKRRDGWLGVLVHRPAVRMYCNTAAPPAEPCPCLSCAAVSGSVRCLAMFVDEQGDEQVGPAATMP